MQYIKLNCIYVTNKTPTMKKTFKLTFTFILVFLLLASSGCELFKKSNVDLLQDHIWNWDRITTTSTNETVQGLIALSSIFMTGATLQFYSDGTYTIKMLEDEESGDWDLINDDEVLLMDGDEMTIIKLTKDALVLDSEVVSVDYGTYNVTMYWKN